MKRFNIKFAEMIDKVPDKPAVFFNTRSQRMSDRYAFCLIAGIFQAGLDWITDKNERDAEDKTGDQ